MYISLTPKLNLAFYVWFVVMIMLFTQRLPIKMGFVVGVSNS